MSALGKGTFISHICLFGLIYILQVSPSGRIIPVDSLLRGAELISHSVCQQDESFDWDPLLPLQDHIPFIATAFIDLTASARPSPHSRTRSTLSRLLAADSGGHRLPRQEARSVTNGTGNEAPGRQAPGSSGGVT